MNKDVLENWIIEALQSKGGQSTLLEICKYVWIHHEVDLKKSGNLFYTWQYDIRWAATELRKVDKLLPADQSPRGVWILQ